MNKKTLLPIASSATTSTLENVENLDSQVERVVRRRSFLKGLGMAGAALSAGALLATDVQAEELPDRQPDTLPTRLPCALGRGRQPLAVDAHLRL